MDIKEYNRQWRLKNREKIKDYKRQYYLDNKEKRREYLSENKEKIQDYHKEYYLNNKKDIAIKVKEYRSNNKDKIKDYHKEYYSDNKEKIKEYQSNNKEKINDCKKVYESNRRKTDLNFKIRKYLRNRLNKALKNNQKVGSAVKDLGCSIEDFKKYIESKFRLGMIWDNYGEWEYDHIIPLSSFNLSNREEFLKASHYTNYQPLWKIDNIRKGDKIL